jgi:hypothetical protein
LEINAQAQNNIPFSEVDRAVQMSVKERNVQIFQLLMFLVSLFGVFLTLTLLTWRIW